VTTDSLAAHIELHAHAPPAGKVVFENIGATEMGVWRTGNSWGDEALSFELKSAGGIERIVRKPQVYTVNVPAAQMLSARGRYAVPFDLGDGSWQLEASFRWDVDAELVALYDVPESPDALAQHAWIGHLRSAPVRLMK